jgi:hypothetical protein
MILARIDKLLQYRSRRVTLAFAYAKSGAPKGNYLRGLYAESLSIRRLQVCLISDRISFLTAVSRHQRISIADTVEVSLSRGCHDKPQGQGDK